MNSDTKCGTASSGGHLQVTPARQVVVIPGRGMANAATPSIAGRGRGRGGRGNVELVAGNRGRGSARVVYKGKDTHSRRNIQESTNIQQHNTNNLDAPRPQPWKHSDAKRHLQALLDDPNNAIHQMLPDEVYNSCYLYQEYKRENFKRNLQKLRASTENRAVQINFDRHAVDNLPKRPMLTNAGHPFWDGSEAQQILKLALSNGQFQGWKPKEVYKHNDEFQKFPLNVFRNHFYKAQASKTSSAYWQMRQKLKKKRCMGSSS